jgi:amino acid adenylation domain-containing protein
MPHDGEPLELPFQLIRLPGIPASCEQASIVLSCSQSDSIRALAKAEQVSWPDILLTAFGAVLYRYTHAAEFWMGLSVPGRGLAEPAGLSGTLRKTLCLRISCDDNTSFRELLAGSAGKEAAELPEYCKTMFTVDELPAFEPLTRLDCRGDLDLCMRVAPGDAGIRVSLEYPATLFERASILRMLGHFETLLAAALLRPEAPISSLNLLTVAEVQQFEEWNNTQAEYPEKPFPQLFEQQAAATPDAVAAVFGDAVLTYRELDNRAGALAAELQARGAGPEVLIGIFITRSLDLLVALLGVMKSGAAYVPLDPFFPQERLEFMIADAKIDLLLSHTSLASRIPAGASHSLFVDSLPLREPHEDRIACPAKMDAPAYVLYTSGSTGQPKGVTVLHRGLTNFLCAMRSELGIGSDDVLLSVTTISFDIAALELYLPLLVGARVVIASRECLTDGRRLTGILEESGATWVQATPATWQLLIGTGWQGSSRLRLLCGGEAMTPNLRDQLLARAEEVWNLYGPTETTIWSTLYKVHGDAASVSIGKPIANTQIYILDQNFRMVPIGVTGDLYIGGDGLARGYLNRAELTAQRFIPNPFESHPSARIYATGDLAQFRADGTIDFRGRSDNQVKIRGYRIELSEIEAILSLHPAVRQAAVKPQRNAAGDSLTAWVVPDGDQQVSTGTLRSFVGGKLPSYMVPSRVIFLAELPLTPNGKVDRRRLTAPAEIFSTEDPPPPTGRTSSERKLVEIWQRLLDVRSVGISDSFFDLGGNSLLAAVLCVEVERAFDRRLTPTTIFEAPTIELLARKMDEAQELRNDTPSLVAIQPQGTQPRLFCFHAAGGHVMIYQEFAKVMGPDQPIYALQAQGTDGRGTRHTRIEEMASHYVAEIRAFQPEGPYFLTGFSLGGLVALEISRLLVDAGHQVALTAMIDSWGPGYPRYPSGLQCYKHLIPRAANKLREGLANLRSLPQRIMKPNPPLPAPLVDTHCRLVQAEKEYKSRYYDGRVVLFRATEQPTGAIPDRTLGWERIIRNLDVVEIPGDHMLLLRQPAVQQVARHIRILLRDAALATPRIDTAWSSASRRL